MDSPRPMHGASSRSRTSPKQRPSVSSWRRSARPSRRRGCFSPAIPPDGWSISTDPATAARFAAYRLELHEERLTLAGIAEREGIRYAPDLLVPYSHWITPTIEPRRFDTRFFLARLPEGQVAVHDRMELTESRWMTPALALAEHAAGRIVLMPPTLKTIEELQAFSLTGHLFAAARSRRIGTILPEAFRTADSFGVRLPNDAEYTLDAFRQPPRPGETSRIVMQDGIWRTFTV